MFPFQGEKMQAVPSLINKSWLRLRLLHNRIADTIFSCLPLSHCIVVFPLTIHLVLFHISSTIFNQAKLTNPLELQQEVSCILPGQVMVVTHGSLCPQHTHSPLASAAAWYPAQQSPTACSSTHPSQGTRAEILATGITYGITISTTQLLSCLSSHVAAQAALPDSKRPVAKAVSLLGKQGATVGFPWGSTSAWPPTCRHTGGSCWWLTAEIGRGFLSAWSYTKKEPSVLLQDQV